MKFEIKNRWTGEAIFACELSAEVAGQNYALQLGSAVKQAVAAGALLRNASLDGASLDGALLDGASLDGASLDGASLDGASLVGALLRNASLVGASLDGASLVGALLRNASLDGASLRNALLDGASLDGASLRNASLDGAKIADYSVRIDNIHQAVYAAASQEGALNMRNWHTCETTHCRAGWVVALAGEDGRALEFAMGTPAAAAIIYIASDPKLERVPDFYCSNEAALADMKRLAEQEAAR